MADDLLVGGHELVPLATVGQVIGVEFPVLERVGEAVLQPALLFLLGDMQEDFHDGCAFVGEHALEFHHMLLAPPPDVVGKEFFHAHGDDVLVVAAVEDDELPAVGHLLMDAPQEVIGQFMGGGLFE